MRFMRIHCECSDPGCPVCKGQHERAHRAVLVAGDRNNIVELERIDLGGYVSMCEACAEDALDSGVFAIEED